ncbi:MAG: 4'-phosphopantetheinyl transferase superfamily protein [Desulfobacterales bacterium]|nr:4'-phosphopantetheinyl transferase superfamily protein [Desulfobacterales bacterium]
MGNDIVDLRDANSAGKSQDERFVGRVLVKSEMREMERAKFPDKWLWSAWAAKETAYKVISKARPDIKSSPRSYEVSFEDAKIGEKFPGRVATPAETVHILLSINENYIHCIGRTGKRPFWKDIISEANHIAPDPGCGGDCNSERQSAAVRLAARKRIASIIDLRADDIAIERSKGPRGPTPPAVYIRGEMAEIDISLSHHGRFAAFAFHGGNLISTKIR